MKRWWILFPISGLLVAAVVWQRLWFPPFWEFLSAESGRLSGLRSLVYVLIAGGAAAAALWAFVWRKTDSAPKEETEPVIPETVEKPPAPEADPIVQRPVVVERSVSAAGRGVAIGGDSQGGNIIVTGDRNVIGGPLPAPPESEPPAGDLEGTTRGYPDGVVYPVWFGTNRKPAALADGFASERHNRTTLGRVEVYVPEAHRFSETGSGFWRRLLRFDLRDDRLRLQRIDPRERDAFFAEIRGAMRDARETGEQPHALLFLHGYNVSFEEAAIRAAQIGYDLKVPGATAFFSWPSRGSVGAYPVDEASIEASEPAITRFLADFTAHCGADKVHVIAHSMGNRGLLRALQRIAANAQTRGKVKLAQVFLAAPDVDRDLFLDLARLYPEHAERTTLYASDGDLAVHLSAMLHDAPRAGYYTPYTVAPGVDTVAVPDFDVDLLGHAYFAQAEALLHDIYDLMRHSEAPAQRQRITPAVHEGATFWRLRR